ncbi:MAG: hypothetical protein OK436_01595 [Thaumarchaeota archaeon]|nr:hypothetical protein [Nitrososphaerota archaeon]
MKLAKVIGWGILLLMCLALIASPAFASAMVVQTTSCTGCSSLAYGSNITAGNLLVVVIADLTSGSTNLITVFDLRGNNWQPAVIGHGNTGSYCGGSACNLGIFYATALTSAADTVEFVDPGGVGGSSFHIFEVSGTSNALSGTASGSYSCPQNTMCTEQTAGSNSFTSQGFLVGGIDGECVSGITASEAGYTAQSATGSSAAAIYSVSGVTSPTRYGMTMTCGNTEVGAGPILGAEFPLAPAPPSQSTTTATSTLTSTATSTTSITCTSTTTSTSTVTTTVTITTTVHLLTYTVTTDPPGLGASINVDGVTYNSPQTFAWSVGSTHTIIALSPCNLANSPYTAFTFVSWSDSGSQSHSVVAPASSTVYTAKFKTTATTVSCGSPNPLQLLEKGCVVPALVIAWSAPIGLQPWLGFILLAVNVAVYNKTQSIWLTLTILWVTGGVFSFFLPPYVSLVAQVFLYLGTAGIVIKGILLVR